jgi:hypothetical protein
VFNQHDQIVNPGSVLIKGEAQHVNELRNLEMQKCGEILKGFLMETHGKIKVGQDPVSPTINPH